MEESRISTSMLPSVRLSVVPVGFCNLNAWLCVAPSMWAIPPEAAWNGPVGGLGGWLSEPRGWNVGSFAVYTLQDSLTAHCT